MEPECADNVFAWKCPQANPEVVEVEVEEGAVTVADLLEEAAGEIAEAFPKVVPGAGAGSVAGPDALLLIGQCLAAEADQLLHQEGEGHDLDRVPISQSRVSISFDVTQINSITKYFDDWNDLFFSCALHFHEIQKKAFKLFCIVFSVATN